MNQQPVKFLLPVLGLVLLPSMLLAQQLGGTPGDAKLKPGATTAGSNVFSHNAYTGTSDVVIPINSFGTEYGDFGVSFSYNTKGIKVDEPASEIGLHWNLNGVPSITRVVKDLPDELNIQADTFLTKPGRYGVPPSEEIFLNKYWRVKGKYATYTESTASAADNQIYRDTETDDFTINLPGGTYTFNLGKNGHHFVHPAKNLKIETIFNGTVLTDINSINAGESPTSNYMDFVITFPSGVKCYFKRSEYTDKSLQDLYGYGEMIAAYYLTTKWVVEKVVLPNGSEIKYTYDNSYVVNAFWGLSFAREERESSLSDPSVSVDPGYALNAQRIRTIEYPNGTKAEFIYDETKRRVDIPDYALQEIKISDAANCLRYKLDQAYFFSEQVAPGRYELGYSEALPGATTERDRKSRLKLKGVRILSCDGTIEEPFYTFEYNEADHLPMRGSLSQDYFGYANGFVNDPSGTTYSLMFNNSIPRHTYVPTSGSGASTTYGVDRSQDLIVMRANILKKIKNGYGGEIEFYYGAHPLSEIALPGLPSDTHFYGKNIQDGFKVDSIIERDSWHPSNTRVSVFQYDNGQIFLNGGYFHYPSVRHNTTDVDLEKIFTGNFMTQHQYVQGANQGYGSVTTITKTGEGKQLNRQVVTFTNFSDATSGSIPRYFFTGGGKHFYTFPYTNKKYIKDWEMGLPLTVTNYDEYDKISDKTTNTYQFTLDTTSTIGYVENNKISQIKTDVYDGRLIVLKSVTDYYRPYTGVALLQSSVTQKYISDSRSINDTISFTYDNLNNPKTIVTRNSEGLQLRTEQLYNYNLNAGTGTTVYNINQAGIEKNIGSLRWQVGTGGFTTDLLIDGNFTTYSYSSGKLLPVSTYKLQNAAPLTYAAYTGYTGGPALPYPNDVILPAFSGLAVNNYKQASKVISSDLKGNPLETQMNAQNQYLSMIWDTVSGKKLAEATNCNYKDIAYASFENNEPGIYSSSLVTRGNFTFYTNQIINAGSIGAATGRKIYALTTTSNQDIVGIENLTVGKEYIISFWAKGSVPRLFCNDIAISLMGANVYNQPATGWKFYQVRFTPGTTGKVKVSGPATPTPMYFDELRLYPADAVMNSWTYEPMYGTSSQTDATGRITYYEYDAMGRNTIVRDQERNIISRKQFVMAGAE